MRYVSAAGVGPSRRRKLDGNGSRRQHAARHGSAPPGTRRRRALHRAPSRRGTAPLARSAFRFQARQSPADVQHGPRPGGAKKGTGARPSRCRRWQPSRAHIASEAPERAVEEPAAAAPAMPPAKEAKRGAPPSAGRLHRPVHASPPTTMRHRSAASSFRCSRSRRTAHSCWPLRAPADGSR